MDDCYLCSRCRSAEFGAFVLGGSYFTRCLHCGEEGPATSWLALSAYLAGEMRAVVVDENLNEIEVLGQGSGAQIWQVVSKAAYQGKLVRLMEPA